MIVYTYPDVCPRCAGPLVVTADVYQWHGFVYCVTPPCVYGVDADRTVEVPTPRVPWTIRPEPPLPASCTPAGRP